MWQAAFDRNILLTPSSTIGDLVDNEHLADREFWVDHDAGNGSTARFPGPLVRHSVDQPSPLGPAPTLGAANGQIDTDRRPSVPATPVPGSAGRRPLEGVNVLEFSWVIATPSAVRVLCDYGATVVKVENAGRPDTMRTVNPFQDEDPHPDNSVGYGVYNAGKRSISLDLSKPESREVVLDLVRWADIVTESFAPGAIARLGYGYDELSKINPELIMLSSSLLGQTGPASSLAGYGFMAAALAGIYDITGWPDRDPAGPYGPYTDYLAPKIVVSSLVTALEHRDRTGKGQYIDLSQTECALHYLAPAILDQSVNGRTLTRQGNDDPRMYPHGVYPDARERPVGGHRVRRRLVAHVRQLGPRPQGSRRDAHRRATSPSRRDRRTAPPVDSRRHQRVGGRNAPGHRRGGVPGARPPRGCATTRSWLHRGHHVLVPQGYAGEMWTHGCRTKMSRTPAQLARGGPCLGEDSFEVLTEFLGYDADRVAELAVAEVLE